VNFDAGQINVVVPNVTAGVVMIVTRSLGSSAVPGYRADFSACVFLWATPLVASRDFSCAPDGLSGLPTVPAKPGDVIILWGTGSDPPIRRQASRCRRVLSPRRTR
jgi:uncharacterized protein (TIGR03437 family)